MDTTTTSYNLNQCAKLVYHHLVSLWEASSQSPETLTKEIVFSQALNVAPALFPVLSETQRQTVATMINHKLFGLGPLEPLLQRPEVTEIMINGLTSAFIEVNGQLEAIGSIFETEDEILMIINKIVSRVGRRIDESVPFVDARLPDGSRVNAIIKPLSIKGPVLTIRKFPDKPLALSDLVAKNALTENMANFLTAAVQAKKNILISGGTGCGKTSLLNALSSHIPVGERLITIEDAAEIKLAHPHVVSLEARLPNIEGQGEIPVRTLLKNALRMRPDRIIVGETRGGEALDMLQAMNTGHQGSLTTVHANSPHEALLRLETMALMADANLPSAAVKAQIKNAIHLVIQMERLVSGQRKIVSISETVRQTGLEEIAVDDIFTFDKSNNIFTATGKIPAMISRFSDYGVAVDINWFK